MNARWSCVAVVVCALGRIASADDDTTWDGTYDSEAAGGPQLCPAGTPKLVVSGGKFSFAWNVRFGNGVVPFGKLDGTARSSGLVTMKVTLLDRAKVADTLEKLGDKFEDLQDISNAMTLAFRAKKSGERELRLSGKMCYARWLGPANDSAPDSSEETTKPAKPTKPTDAVKSSKPTTAAKPVKAPKPSPPPAAKKKTNISKTSGSSSSKTSGSSSSGSSKSSGSSSSGSQSSGSQSSSKSSGSSGSSKSSGNKGGRGNGLACTYNSDCASDTCAYHVCKNADSSDKEYAPGATCDWSSDCASGNCSDKKCR